MKGCPPLWPREEPTWDHPLRPLLDLGQPPPPWQARSGALAAKGVECTYTYIEMRYIHIYIEPVSTYMYVCVSVPGIGLYPVAKMRLDEQNTIRKPAVITARCVHFGITTKSTHSCRKRTQEQEGHGNVGVRKVTESHMCCLSQHPDAVPQCFHEAQLTFVARVVT